MTLVVRETVDLNEIKKVMLDPEIYGRVKVDNKKADITLDNALYIGGYVNGEIVAVMVYYKQIDVTTCHVQVLKSHRAALAVKFGKMALELRCDDILYTTIPSRYPDVIRFSKHFGFKYVTTMKNKSIKDGKACDLNVYRWEFSL